MKKVEIFFRLFFNHTPNYNVTHLVGEISPKERTCVACKGKMPAGKLSFKVWKNLSNIQFRPIWRTEQLCKECLKQNYFNIIKQEVFIQAAIQETKEKLK